MRKTGEDEAIRELAERLLSHVGPDGAHSARLYPGRLPDGVELPLPPGSRLIGSLLREPGFQTDRDLEVVLDVPDGEDQALAFYDASLGAKGWAPIPELTPQRGGFSSFSWAPGRIFRHEGEGVALSVSAQSRAPGETEVRIRSQWMPEPEPFESHPRPPGSDLPSLRPPPGVSLNELSSGGGGGSWSSNASIKTALPVADLEAHFAAQLAAAGWKRVKGAAAGPLAYSTWTMPGKWERAGFLFVFEAPGEDRRFLTLRVDVLEGPAGGSWQSFTSALRRG